MENVINGYLKIIELKNVYVVGKSMKYPYIIKLKVF